MAWVNDNKIVEWVRGGYELSTDRDRLDIEKIHHFLSEQSDWARGQSRDTLMRSIAHSLALGLYYQGQQIGFARIVTDFARLAYVMDIFIDEAFRGRGLGTWLSAVVRSHPDLVNVSKWMLTTRDAQPVYQRAGWNLVTHPESIMEITHANPAAHCTIPLAETRLTVKPFITKDGPQ
ncbi:GNAT family N-acetyltransferase [Rouxiella badensis]|uniref:GNAT family N-acetyltransferase n=1 Tax=Rouxiella badensis TaxID=1646377 RepID=UPI0028D1E998|nr:GNAT family N-acetyltransferase [Rouxiella badensis]